MAEVLTLRTATEVLRELGRLGYMLEVGTRLEVVQHHVGPHLITYADKLRVKPVDIPEPLQLAIRAHRDELLAAACLLNPPVRWVAVLTERVLAGDIPAPTLAADIAAFMDLNAAHDGPQLEPIVGAALRLKEQAREGAA